MGPAIPDDSRVAALLEQAELLPAERIPKLTVPPAAVDFQASLPTAPETARALLVQQRIREPGYQAPETQLRDVFRSKKRKKAARNGSNLVFTKYEVAKSFQSLICNAPLPSPGVAQALLAHACQTSLEELWRCLYSSKAEKGTKNRTSFLTSAPPRITWLDIVTGQDNLQYVRLLCQAQIGQDALDRAFSIALSKRFMATIALLLGFGAVASDCQEAIRKHVRLNDVALTKLLLSAPSNAMSVDAWRYCLEPEITRLRSPHILLLCLAHRPDVACGSLLLKALLSQNLQATAIILAYAGPDNNFSAIRQRACELASWVEHRQKRLKFFTMLAQAGLVEDEPVVRQQLMREVKARTLALVEVFVTAGVTVDISPNNALLWAITTLDFEMLEILKIANISSPLSPLLKHVPGPISEGDLLRLLGIFSLRGPLAGESLDWHLARAVRRREKKLIGTLVRLGASIEFDQASAVRAALKTADFAILNFLLHCRCSPDTLSFAIPDAMLLQPKSNRLQAMKALLKKGVHGPELAVPLQRAVSEDAEADVELIQLLLQHEAPVDGGARYSNPLLVATRKGNVPVLRMLCDAEVGCYTLSEAIPIAYRMRNTYEPNVIMEMIELLLEKGARGPPVDLVLLSAVQSSELDTVRLLVNNGADANRDSGVCFFHAAQTSNIRLLEILCTKCPPTQVTAKDLLHRAVDPKYYSLPVIEILLRTAPSSATLLKASWNSLAMKDNPNMIEIVPCFLRYGLDVEVGDGSLLRIAIGARNTSLLTQILSWNPSTVSLRRAFMEATKVKARSVQLDIMESLLEKAYSIEIGQSDQLLQETHAALAGDSQGLKVLIRHKAIDDFEGKAIQAAAAAGSLSILNMLLSLEAASFHFKKACLAAAKSTVGGDQKQQVVERILDFRKPSKKAMSELLTDSISSAPKCIRLPKSLLNRGAEVGFETLKDAVQNSSRDLFGVLVEGTKDGTTQSKTFRFARNALIHPDRRYWVFEHLLQQHGIPNVEVSEALLDWVSAGKLEDLSLPKLLLRHGADVRYKNGEAFTMAFRSNSLYSVKLLSQYITDDETACHVFDLLWKTSAFSSDARLELYRRLLQRKTGISSSSIYSALVDNLKSRQRDLALIRLLLANGADPNRDNAQCFLIAAKAGAKPEFRALSKQGKSPVVLKALLDHLKDEMEIVQWLRICLEEQTERETIKEDDLVLQCLRKFPEGTSLLRLLLDNGASVSVNTRHRLGPGWEAEDCTLLIWALITKSPRIETDAILVLLERGQKAVLPAYATSRTKLSAAFACVLDQTRAPVLKALLNLDRGNITKHVMDGKDFGSLVTSAYHISDELECFPYVAKLNLVVACLVSGNFKAFVEVLSKCGDDHTEGALHFAAQLALPKFVGWLLHASKWDPNNGDLEDYNFLIPLAVACSAKRAPDCVIANTEGRWTHRQKVTMKLLASETDISWRNHNKQSVLHIALDNGPEVTKLMVEALNISHDPARDEKYLFEDRTGLFYSPDQYVRRILRLDLADQKLLLSALKPGRMTPRYFRAVSPRKGTQPEGYIGLPSELARLWESHEKGRI
ncbi:hypothetical protein DL768_007562 [Monosporascus sp. mg162]|nr:hypothetical protein DL768_007562 [Monosporascus sp. mg162]